MWSRSSLANQLLELRLLADRIEVRISGRERAEPLRPLDRAAKVLDRIGRPPGEALAARDVVEQAGVLGVLLDQFPATIRRLVVLAGLVERGDRQPDLEARRLVDLTRRTPDRDDRGARGLGERRPLDAGAGKDHRPGRRVHPLAVELEGRAALLHEVELLVLIGLVMLVDYAVARTLPRPRVDAERHDAEVLADGPERTAAVAELVDLVDPHHGVITHMAS